MSVLFVDEEQQILKGIERMLDAAEVDWDSFFANDPSRALELLTTRDEIDTIVTDINLVLEDGDSLLNCISEDHPHLVRIVLSGEVEKDRVFKAMNPMHQYLTKPCEANVLTQTINRARLLRDILNCEHLQRLVGGIKKLPSVPTVYSQLIKALQSDATSDQIGEIVSRDPAMTIKLLQLANSAVFGLRYPVDSAAQAITVLGTETVKALVLSVGVFQLFEGTNVTGFSMEKLMDHGLAVGALAREITSSETGSRELAGTAFSAGMIHDVGKLILATEATDSFESALKLAKEENLDLWKAERKILSVDHAAIGAHLLNIWGLPKNVVEVVAMHHIPNESQENTFSILTAVSAANAIIQLREKHGAELRAVPSFMVEYLGGIQCSGKFEEWYHLANFIDG